MCWVNLSCAPWSTYAVSTKGLYPCVAFGWQAQNIKSPSPCTRDEIKVESSASIVSQVLPVDQTGLFSQCLTQ